MAQHRSTSRKWIQVLALAVPLGAACSALTACDETKRRYFDTCSEDDDCESSVCYNGHCTASCTSNAGCGTGICVESHCLPTGAPCDDGDPCTLGDVVGMNICKAGPDKKNCGAATECQEFYCQPTQGCDAKAKNVGQTCGGSSVKVCADGSLLSGGCKCAAWQGNPIGPYDEVAIGGGTTTAVPKGLTQIRGIAPLAGKAVLVGVAKASATDPQWTAWLAVVNSAAQNLATSVLSTGNSQWNGVDAEALVAVGQVAGKAALLPLADTLAKGSLAGQQPMQPVAGDSILRAVAASTQSVLAVGQTGASEPLLVRLTRSGGGLATTPQVNPTVLHPQPGPCELNGIAASSAGFIAVGSCVVAGNGAPWYIRVNDDTGMPVAVASNLLTVPDVSSVHLTGVTANASGELMAWGSAKTATSTQIALALGLDAAGKVLWSAPINPGDAKSGDLGWFTGGAAWYDNTWLLVGGRSGSTTAPWAMRTSGAKLYGQSFGSSANALSTAVRGNGAVFIGGSHGDRAWLERYGPAGETECK